LAAYGDPEAAFAMDAESMREPASATDESAAGAPTGVGTLSTVRLQQVLAEIESARARLDAVLAG
jgi:hypothetical protein